MRELHEWVTKSHQLPGIKSKPILTYDFQSLGVLDLTIEEKWEKIKDKPSDNIWLFNEVNLLSRLWILAGYEITRVLAKENKNRFELVYQKFRRLRVPMVKHTPVQDKKTKRYPTDYTPPLNSAVTSDTKEFGWEVGPNTIITRNSIADDLLGS